LGQPSFIAEGDHDVRQAADRNGCDRGRQLCGPDDRSSSAGEADRANRNTQPAKSGHAAVNGVNYYYAVYGHG